LASISAFAFVSAAAFASAAAFQMPPQVSYKITSPAMCFGEMQRFFPFPQTH
jgi:hypothetical protein